jgi:hypothetical protein
MENEGSADWLSCQTESGAKQDRSGQVDLVVTQAVLASHRVRLGSQSNCLGTKCLKARCHDERNFQGQKSSGDACACLAAHSRRLQAMQSIVETCGQAMGQMGRDQSPRFPAYHDDCLRTVSAVVVRKVVLGTVLTLALTSAPVPRLLLPDLLPVLQVLLPLGSSRSCPIRSSWVHRP